MRLKKFKSRTDGTGLTISKTSLSAVRFRSVSRKKIVP